MERLSYAGQAMTVEMNLRVFEECNRHLPQILRNNASMTIEVEMTGDDDMTSKIYNYINKLAIL